MNAQESVQLQKQRLHYTHKHVTNVDIDLSCIKRKRNKYVKNSSKVFIIDIIASYLPVAYTQRKHTNWSLPSNKIEIIAIAKCGFIVM